MVKTRPVVIISPRLRNRDNLCTVVPLSQSEPKKIQAYHYEMTLPRPLPSPWSAGTYWVKADMMATVAFHRLHLIGIGKDHEGKRKYLTSIIPCDDLRNIRICLLHALGMKSLTEYV